MSRKRKPDQNPKQLELLGFGIVQDVAPSPIAAKESRQDGKTEKTEKIEGQGRNQLGRKLVTEGKPGGTLPPAAPLKAAKSRKKIRPVRQISPKAIERELKEQSKPLAEKVGVALEEMYKYPPWELKITAENVARMVKVSRQMIYKAGLDKEIKKYKKMQKEKAVEGAYVRKLTKSRTKKKIEQYKADIKKLKAEIRKLRVAFDDVFVKILMVRKERDFDVKDIYGVHFDLAKDMRHARGRQRKEDNR